METSKLQTLITNEAHRLGFIGIGFSRVRRLDEIASRLDSWLSKDYHGEMKYMENHYEMRLDPAKLVPGAKTIISLSYNYFSEATPSDPNAPKVAMYAHGRDYHKVVRKKLKALFHFMREVTGMLEGRVFVDSAPIMERDWAQINGLGWVGKHTLLLNPKQGSYFFLGEIICDLDLVGSYATKDYCGTCTRCIDACPTDAISPRGYVLDGSKCISYLTIELKSAIPEVFKSQMENWVFGCDICQQVCPWNRFSKPHTEVEFEAHPSLLNWKSREWEEMTDEMYHEVFSHTPVARAGKEKLMNTLKFIHNDNDKV